MRSTPDRVGAGALVGRRAAQQDTFLTEVLARDGSILAIVADGMGGHAEGALASQLAANAFRDTFVPAHAQGGALRTAFEAALAAANRAVADAQRGHPEREGMGTTLLATHLSPKGLAWISVGDSLLLVEADGALRRLNEDHSMRAVENRGRASANMLRSAVSGVEIALVDCRPEPVRVGDQDRIIVASDGLLTLSMDLLAQTLAASRAAAPQALADRILALVAQEDAPRQDNCTVLVLQPSAEAAPAIRVAKPMRPLMLVGLGLVAVALVVFALVW